MKNASKVKHLYLIFSVLLLVSCASTPECPPCNPEIEIRDKPMPYPVIIEITMFSPIEDELPNVPTWPGEEASDEEKKEAAVAIGEAREEREAMCIARDRAWRLKVEEHNSQEVDADPELP